MRERLLFQVSQKRKGTRLWSYSGLAVFPFERVPRVLGVTAKNESMRECPCKFPYSLVFRLVLE